jgi:transposase
MSNVQARNPSKEQFWRAHVTRWQASGLSVRDYCSRHRLAEPSFYAWRRTLAQRPGDVPAAVPSAAVTAPVVTFVPLHVQPTTADNSAALEVVLGNGRRLRVPAGFDAATLRAVLDVLEDTSSC